MSDPKARYVDAHCHVDLYPDMEALMARCEADRVLTIAVTTTPRAWPRNMQLASRYSFVEPALGIHPQLVGSGPSELGTWDSYLSQARIIGEVGLDASPRYHRTLDAQKEVFAHVLRECAKVGGKVLTVHSVRTSKQVVDMLEEYLAGSGCTVILHWFTGSMGDARRAADLGCYFSVNADMLSKEAHIKTVQAMPLHRILTESDGPFTKSGTQPRSPSDMPQTVEKLASVIGLERDAMCLKLLDNYVSIFRR